VVLDGLGSWLGLSAEIAAHGLGCIATLEQCDATLGRLGLGGAFAAFSSRRGPVACTRGDLKR
jgi:hypothetical protein